MKAPPFGAKLAFFIPRGYLDVPSGKKERLMAKRENKGEMCCTGDLWSLYMKLMRCDGAQTARVDC